jgi:mannose-6-phosphate isomerase-like protein (cupin superfamily)
LPKACVSFEVFSKQEKPMSHFLDWREHAGSQPEKFYKSTLWQGQRFTLGLNCLEPGQIQKVHAHDDADKIYYVLEGEGNFTIGDEQRNVATGMAVVAPAGVPHGVVNNINRRLSLLVAISPPIK